MSSEDVRARWQKRVTEGFPSEDLVGARSRAVAGAYARFYLKYPEIYKWAGVGAFACHRIGLALAVYDYLIFDGVVMKVDEDYADAKGAQAVYNDLNHLRLANNDFFADVAWALEAYVAPDGGLAEVEAGLEGYENHENLLEAFRKIDRGRSLLESAATRDQGEALIWEATILIEYHGQVYSAQRFYDTTGKDFNIFMSVFTTMNFEVHSFGITPSKFTNFYLFMWTGGLLRLLRTWSPPNLARMDHRWYWIEKRVMRLWRKIDLEDPTVRRAMVALMRAGGIRIAPASEPLDRPSMAARPAAAGALSGGVAPLLAAP